MQTSRFSPRFLAAALALAICLAATRSAHADTVYNKTLQSTGFVVVMKDNKPATYGTCWIVDTEKRLVVTNQHVVRYGEHCWVAFPRFDNGQLLTNSGSYTQHDYIAGKVLARNSGRDLALVQLDRLPGGVRALEMASASIAPGQKVWAIGNSGMALKAIHDGQLWRGRSGTVNKSFFMKTTLKEIGQVVATCMIETNSGARPGDSGGPVVDEQGRLVGVNSCTNEHGDNAVDVLEVKDFLKYALQRRFLTPAHQAIGCWTVTWKHKDRELFASMMLSEDGTASWVSAKKAAFGKHTLKDGKLVLNVPGGLQATANVVWLANGQFAFTVVFTDATIEFTATKR